MPSLTSHTAAKPTVVDCHDCKPHAYQDGKLGRNRRHANPCANGGYRCTVCGAVKRK